MARTGHFLKRSDLSEVEPQVFSAEASTLGWRPGWFADVALEVEGVGTIPFHHFERRDGEVVAFVYIRRIGDETGAVVTVWND